MSERPKPRPVQAPQSKSSQPGGRSRWLPWIIVGVVAVVAAILAVVLTSGSGTDTAPTAQIEVDGAALPTLTDSADLAVGSVAPGLSGVDLDGARLSIPAGPGNPRLVVFLAHWCPHCRAEVPRIVVWSEQSGGVAGVDVYAVATATDSRRPNYPPTAWLEREKWPYPTLLDDSASTAAASYGLSAYPFFVFVDASGKVVSRSSGEMPVDELESKLVALQQAALRGEEA